jgi:hypothetical protein
VYAYTTSMKAIPLTLDYDMIAIWSSNNDNMTGIWGRRIFYNAETNAIQQFNNLLTFGVIEYNDLLIGFLSLLLVGISNPLTYPAFFNLSSSESLNVPEILKNWPLKLIAIFSDIWVVLNGSLIHLKPSVQ